MSIKVLTQVAATAFAEVGWKFYLTFIIVPACGLPVLWRLPETKGLTLEQISVLFGDESSRLDAAHVSDFEKDYRVREQYRLSVSSGQVLIVIRGLRGQLMLSRIPIAQGP